jgi:hypothetical protein
MFEDRCMAQERAIGERFHAGGRFAAQIEISANSVFGFRLGELRGIAVNFKLHVGSKVPYSRFRVSTAVIEEM